MQRMSLSFCGCGFLGVYHLGVVSCLMRHGHGFLSRLDRVAGASAGALAATLVVTCLTPRHVEAAREIVTTMARNLRHKPLGALTPGYQVTRDIERMLNEMLPHDAHQLARGKLHVSLTNLRSKRNEVVSDFESRDELIKVLAASCHIPVYSGGTFLSLWNKPYCDGGLTNNLIRFKEGRTVTVSPFSGPQDISPQDPVKNGQKPVVVNLRNHRVQVTVNNIQRFSYAFFPPEPQILHQYFRGGGEEARRFLVREGCYETDPAGDKNS